MTLGYARKLCLTGRYSRHGEKIAIPTRDAVSKRVGGIYGAYLRKLEDQRRRWLQGCKPSSSYGRPERAAFGLKEHPTDHRNVSTTKLVRASSLAWNNGVSGKGCLHLRNKGAVGAIIVPMKAS
jgi:hypothetical protein